MNERKEHIAGLDDEHIIAERGRPTTPIRHGGKMWKRRHRSNCRSCSHAISSGLVSGVLMTVLVRAYLSQYRESWSFEVNSDTPVATGEATDSVLISCGLQTLHKLAFGLFCSRSLH